MTKKDTKQKIFSTLKILFWLWIAASLVSSIFSQSFDMVTGNVAVIPVHGVITVGEPGSFSSGVTSDEVIDLLEQAENSNKIKAIVLDVNSPGGSGVAADEIGQKIKSIDKPVVTVIRDVGASAAYWIASASDYIFANRLSLTGSIGVIGSYLEFDEFIEEHNVTYRRYVSGELKDMGSPFKEPSEEEQELFQSIIDQMEQIFIEEVAMNRNLSTEEVEELATGQVYLGVEAEELNLVDALGTKQDAYNYIEEELNITVEPTEFKKERTLSDVLTELTTIKIGKFINPASPSFELR